MAKRKSNKITRKASKDNELIRRVKERLTREYGQFGGRDLDSSGGFSNLVSQLSGFIENTIYAITNGVQATYSVLTLPMDLSASLDRPNEPLPSNTPIGNVLDGIDDTSIYH